MNTFHQPDTLMVSALVVCFLGLIAGLLAMAWSAYKNRQIQRFCNDELDMLPWNAAAKAFNSGKPAPELFASAQSKASAVIGGSVLQRCFNSAQLAEMEYDYAVSEMNSHIAADPLTLAVYSRVIDLCRQAREQLTPFGKSIASVRTWLEAQVSVAIVEETRRFGAPICQAEIDAFKTLSADDAQFQASLNRWLAGDGSK